MCHVCRALLAGRGGDRVGRAGWRVQGDFLSQEALHLPSYDPRTLVYLGEAIRCARVSSLTPELQTPGLLSHRGVRRGVQSI